MRTLFFCGVATHTRRGQSALWRWWFHYRPYKEMLKATHYGANNDGCENLPVEHFVKLHDATQPIAPFEADVFNITYWPSSLGRSNIYTYPGYWRSVLTSVQIARAQNFDKLLYVEWDFFILSESMMREVANTDKGLVAYWAPFYKFPEGGFIICGSDQYDALEDNCNRVLKLASASQQDICEISIPWTDVRKHRVGDRYPERTTDLPVNADYCAQMPINMLVRERKIEVLAQEKCAKCGTSLSFNLCGLLMCPTCHPNPKTVEDIHVD